MDFSTGMLNFIANKGSWQQATANGRLKLIDGAMPVNADGALSGTLLATVTVNGAAFTAETRALGSVQVTAGTVAADTIQVKVGGIPVSGVVAWAVSHANTATLLADVINNYTTGIRLDAVVDAGDNTKVNLYAPFGAGSNYNGVVVTTVLGGAAATTLVNFSGGVTSVNGLSFISPPTMGKMLALANEVWMGTNIATGTARYARWEADPDDDGLASTVFRRIQGSAATSGGDFNLSSTSLVTGASVTVTTKEFQV